jgi:hypothetical protein
LQSGRRDRQADAQTSEVFERLHQPRRCSASAGNGPGRCGNWGLRVPSCCRSVHRG